MSIENCRNFPDYSILSSFLHNIIAQFIIFLYLYKNIGICIIMKKTEKRCSHCKQTKDICNFNKNKSTKDGFHHQCKDCANKYRIKYQKTKTAKIRQKHAMLKYRYSLTKEEYDNLLKIQNNKCPICNIEIIQEKGKYAIDHNHKTNKVRGILCNRCNFIVGILECNDDDIIKNSYKYINNN